MGEYIFDTREFRTEDKEQPARRHLCHDPAALRAGPPSGDDQHPWDLFVMVEMGPDRIHHAFWRYFDPQHPKYVAGNPL